MKAHRSSFNKILILSVFIFILVILFIFGANWWRVSPLNKNKPEYFQDVIEIKKITLINSWTNGVFSYELKNAYLIPYRGDLGKDYYGLLKLVAGPDDQIIAIEISVRNISTTEGSQKVNFTDNFRIRDGNNNNLELSPVSIPLSLLPQADNARYFVYFSVKKGGNNPKLLVGPLGKPAVVDLNFNAENAVGICGTYSAIGGDGFPSLSRNIDCKRLKEFPGRVNVNTLQE